MKFNWERIGYPNTLTSHSKIALAFKNYIQLEMRNREKTLYFSPTQSFATICYLKYKAEAKQMSFENRNTPFFLFSCWPKKTTNLLYELQVWTVGTSAPKHLPNPAPAVHSVHLLLHHTSQLSSLPVAGLHLKHEAHGLNTNFSLLQSEKIKRTKKRKNENKTK